MNGASASRIIVRNAQRTFRVDLWETQLFAEAALRAAGRKFPARRAKIAGIDEIVAVLVSDRRIAALHRRFMNIAGATDVITFQHGEVFISVETAAANAKRYRTSAEAEIRLYIVHGILHLLGFDDTTARVAARMEKAQTAVFKAALAAMARGGSV